MGILNDGDAAAAATVDDDGDGDDGDDDTDGHHSDDNDVLEDVLNIVDTGHIRNTVTIITQRRHVQPRRWWWGWKIKYRRRTKNL